MRRTGLLAISCIDVRYGLGVAQNLQRSAPRPQDTLGSCERPTMTAFIDTNILVTHLTTVTRLEP